MPDPSTVLVVSFDRWPWPALGCYGHDWIDTPAWDQLAADGFLFDRCIALNSPAVSPDKFWSDWLTRLHRAGVQTTLFAEADDVPRDAVGPWSAVHAVGGNSAPDAPLAEQPFARLTQAAMAHLQAGAGSGSSRLVWVQAAGLPKRCPVSRAALELYAADFAAEGLHPSSMTDEELVDHELTRATTLSVLDHFLGELLTVARSLPGRSMQCVFAWRGATWEPAPRPTPLLGPFDPQEMQVPLVIAGTEIEPGRSSALVEVEQVFPTIARWFQVPPDENEFGVDLGPLIAGDVTTGYSSISYRVADRGCLWTADDLTIFARTNGEWNVQRFLWPEDAWAIHDIATQTPDAVAERLVQFQAARPTE